MSDHALPEDLGRWPEDPHELLGVAPGVSARELRRAYTRLIRAFKPERHPEHFRRIREAYDRLAWFAALTSDPAAVAPDEPPAAAGPPQPEAAPAPRPVPDGVQAAPPAEPVEATERAAAPPSADAPQPPAAPKDELADLWNAAVEGGEAGAYARLRQLVEQHAGAAHLYLRLYWLATLYPELDPSRSAIDWLVQGLHATGFDGSLLELFRQELQSDPREAATERLQALLEAAPSPGMALELADLRLRAAFKLSRWDLIERDVRAFRERFAQQDEETWLRFLFGLADQLAWCVHPDAEPLMTLCFHEVRGHEHLSARLGYLYDRFELLIAASNDWKLLRDWGLHPPQLLQLLPLAWTAAPAECHSSVIDLVERIADRPFDWLQQLSLIQQRAPAALGLLGSLLDQFAHEREIYYLEPCPAAIVEAVIREFLGKYGSAGYGRHRDALLRACLREAIAPEQLCETAAGLNSVWADDAAALAYLVGGDWPFRYVWQAWRLHAN